MFSAHGELNDFSFDFRGANYSFHHDEGGFRYTKLIETDSLIQKDVFTSDGFTRVVNGDTLQLKKEENKKYSESLNSVIYFVCLPQKLKDEAENMGDLGQTEIKGENYNTLKVYFVEDGGGEDFEDEFLYWVNAETHYIDYLAYRYNVNGGGVRFRSAYERRIVNGMVFQDYINYEAPFDAELINLPMQYEIDSLNELSRIIIDNITPIH